MEKIFETLHTDWQQGFSVKEKLVDKQTKYQHLQIFDNAYFGRVMVLDGAIQTTDRDEYVYHEMMTHVPILTHGNVKRVLIVGAGDGGIAREVLRHKSIEHTTMVEIDGDVVDCAKQYFPNHSKGAFEDKRMNLIIGDALDFVKTTTEKFDIIITDSTDPIGPGEHLFAEEYYSNCKRILNKGGIVVGHCGVPFIQEAGVKVTKDRLNKFFENTPFYLATIPTYIGGFMGLFLASDEKAHQNIDSSTLAERYANFGGETRYYTPAVHKASFAIPPFIEKLY